MMTFTSWIDSLPFNIRVYLFIAFLFLICSLLFILYIFISQLLKGANRRFRSRYQEEIQHEISLIVVQSSMSEVPDAAFRLKLERLAQLKRKSRYLSQLMLDEIVSMKKNLVGESAGFLKRAYLELDLRTLSVRKVKSRSWKRTAKGLRELEIMEQVDALHHFIVFLNHPNYYLRREARLSLAGLAPNPMFFLDDFSECLSDWEQILLYEKLKRRPRNIIPDFSKWYRHPNRTVVIFCVEMTVQFRQVHNTGKLESLLQDNDDELTCRIVDALRELEAIQSLETVAQVLKQATSSKKIVSCLRFIGSIGDDSYEQLVLSFTSHYNQQVRMEAIRTLHEINGSTEPLNLELQSMLDHIKHPLIV